MLCGNSVEIEVIGGESNFQWYLNGSLIPGANASTYSALSPGLYNCIYTDSCGTRDSVISIYKWYQVMQHSRPGADDKFVHHKLPMHLMAL